MKDYRFNFAEMWMMVLIGIIFGFLFGFMAFA
ncbi:putative TMhelix containing protein [Vibrio phage 381E49-1]|nr:putative TMhelix containing protein [Vibrio phage 381E49-1]